MRIYALNSTRSILQRARHQRCLKTDGLRGSEIARMCGYHHNFIGRQTQQRGSGLVDFRDQAYNAALTRQTEYNPTVAPQILPYWLAMQRYR